MNEKILYGIIGFVIGVAVGYLITANISSDRSMGMMGSRSTAQSSNALDAHFIEQMVPHHEDAITMSRLALTKAQRPEVKQLAQNIISAQQKEIDDMKKWYKEWFGRELPVGSEVMQHHGMGSSSMHMGMMGSEADIAKLENAEDFDKAFIEHMIPHHQMAVMMGSMLKDGTNRSEMKELAGNITSSQTAEIEQMREWLTEWEK